VKRFFLPVLLLVTPLVGCGKKQNPPPPPLPPVPTLSEKAPADQPFESTGKDEIEAQRAAIAPYVEQARKTYPDAKKRYLAGLPKGHHFFAVTRLKDGSGRSEQVFISVAGIDGDRISGRIASDIHNVRGFKQDDPYTFPESELVDWMVARPDGSEEGNVVGKFLDEWQKTRPKK
jgi:hypothetical protein